MSAAHTPGPWAVSYSVDGMSVDTAQPVRFNRTTAGTAVIAHICAHEDAEHFSGEANARLIAAAPDLLEALKDMHQVLQEAMTTGGWVPTPVQASFRDAWFDMTSAIAKATGEGA